MTDIKNWEPSKKYFKNINPFSMLLLASRNSGKSYMIRSLYTHYLKKLYDIVLVFTLSDRTKEYYEEFILTNDNGSTCFLQEMPEDILLYIDTIQKEAMDETGKQLRVLIICDDMAGMDTKMNLGVINCFTRGRHSNVSIIYVSQSPTLVANHIRQNTDVLIILNIRSFDPRLFVAKNFVSDYTQDLDEAIELLGNLHDYRSLVIDYRNNKIYNYKAL